VENLSKDDPLILAIDYKNLLVYLEKFVETPAC